MNTIESIKNLINKYEDIRIKNKTVSNKEIKPLYDYIQSSLEDVLSENLDIKLHRASGSGNLTKKPILYFFHKDKINRATDGTYVALTMISDPKDNDFGSYKLSLTQGTDKLKSESPDKWESILKENSKSIINKIPPKKLKNFIIYPETLKYSKASILQKNYKIDVNIINSDLKNDLREILNIYKSYSYEKVENKKTNKSIVSKEINDSKTLRAIKTRKGQMRFRKKLLKKYKEKCIVTGCKITKILEAAHIVSHSDEGSYSDSNGLLLRSDIHTLYDLGLISIDGDGNLHISKQCQGSEYVDFLKKNPIIKIDSDDLKKNLELRFQNFDPEY